MATSVSIPHSSTSRRTWFVVGSTRWQRWWRRTVVMLASVALLGGAVIAWRYFTWPRPTSRLAFAAQIDGRPRELVSEVFLPRPELGSLPGESRRFPAVILLHGIEGAERYRWSYYQTAHRLRSAGYAVFMVHYFSAVDYPDLWKFTADGNVDHDAIEQKRLVDQQKWVAAVTQTIREISQRDDIDPQRIGIVGYSLGGFISLSAAQRALEDPEMPDVRCVVCNWGAMFRGEEFTSGSPPTLLVHGALDNVVEFKWAEHTHDALANVGADVQLYEVPGGKHIASDATSDRMTFEFLARHLKGQ